MHPFHALSAEHLDAALDPARDFFRRLGFGVFDVHDADPQRNAGAQLVENFQLIVTPPREFKDEMIGLQMVQKRKQEVPEAFLDGLPAVVAETKMHGLLASRRAQNMV